MGSIYQYESPNQHGTFSYLWDTGVTSSFFGSSGTPIQLPQIVTVARAIQAQNLSVIRTGIPYKLNRTTTSLVTNTIWQMKDAHTGNGICYIANVSTTAHKSTAKTEAYATITSSTKELQQIPAGICQYGIVLQEPCPLVN